MFANCFVIQINRWAGSVLQALSFKEDLLTPRETLIKAGCEGACTKYEEGMQGTKYLRVKNAVSNPYPTTQK